MKKSASPATSAAAAVFLSVSVSAADLDRQTLEMNRILKHRIDEKVTLTLQKQGRDRAQDLLVNAGDSVDRRQGSDRS